MDSPQQRHVVQMGPREGVELGLVPATRLCRPVPRRSRTSIVIAAASQDIRCLSAVLPTKTFCAFLTRTRQPARGRGVPAERPCRPVLRRSRRPIVIVRDAALEGAGSREQSSPPKSTRVAGRFQRAGCLRGAANAQHGQRAVAVDELGDEVAAERDRRQLRGHVGPAGDDVVAIAGPRRPPVVRGRARTSPWTGPVAGTVGWTRRRNLRGRKWLDF